MSTLPIFSSRPSLSGETCVAVVKQHHLNVKRWEALGDNTSPHWGFGIREELAELATELRWKPWDAREVNRTRALDELADVFFYVLTVLLHPASVGDIVSSEAEHLYQALTQQAVARPRACPTAETTTSLLYVNELHYAATVFDDDDAHLNPVLGLLMLLDSSAEDLCARYLVKCELNEIRRTPLGKTWERDNAAALSALSCAEHLTALERKPQVKELFENSRSVGGY